MGNHVWTYIHSSLWRTLRCSRWMCPEELQPVKSMHIGVIPLQSRAKVWGRMMVIGKWSHGPCLDLQSFSSYFLPLYCWRGVREWLGGTWQPAQVNPPRPHSSLPGLNKPTSLIVFFWVVFSVFSGLFLFSNSTQNWSTGFLKYLDMALTSADELLRSAHSYSALLCI